MNFAFLHSSPFYEVTVLLVVAVAIGLISFQLHQPMIVSFMITGILAGPGFLGIVQSYEHIELLSSLGISILLFLVGLKLDIHLVKNLGVVALATGIGQVVFTAILGFFIALGFGMDAVNALYVAIALTFSSTIIIVKLLSDKCEVDSLHGRIAIGFLIVQDIFVVLAMVVLSAFGAEATVFLFSDILKMIVYGILVLIFLWFFIRYLANPLVSRIAHSYELLIIFSIAWATLLASLGSYFGFSKELGGLLAGISLASTPYRESIASRLFSLRDFLLLFFFITLGMQLNFSQLENQLIPAIIFSVFVLIGNPLVVLIIMGIMGFRKRTSFLAGLTVAQISEFSLIFMAMGLKVGHVNSDALSMVTLVGLITIAVSVYMITYSQQLYDWLEPLLTIFERKLPYRESADYQQKKMEKSYDVILFGLARYGQAIAEALLKKDLKVLVIDLNPDEVNRWRTAGKDAIYGDMRDMEFIGTLPLKNVRWVICTIPQRTNEMGQSLPCVRLINALKYYQSKAQIAVAIQNEQQIQLLKDKGVDAIFLPFKDAANKVIESIFATDRDNHTQ